jgi:hypothetical protein
MTTGFLANNPTRAGCRFHRGRIDCGRHEPVNTNLNLRKVKLPVVDVYGDNEMDVRRSIFSQVPRFRELCASGGSWSKA